MPDMTVPVGAKQVVIEARIIRAAPECATVCYERGAGRAPCGAGTDVPCRRSRVVEDHGAVAYWHENPARVLAWRLKQALRPVRFWWRTHLISAGRGWGKTLAGAEDVKHYGLTHPGARIAIVARTFADARDTCVEGESGLLSCLPPSAIATYNRSLGELILTNGARYKLFSADEPNRLRGPQHHRAWCLLTGTPIMTASGERAIETIVPGDRVLTRDGYCPVRVTGSRVALLYTVTLADGRTLTGSAEHPVATDRGWIGLSQLSSTDTIWAWKDDGGRTLRATSSATNRGGSSISTVRSGRSTTALSSQAAQAISTTSTRTDQTTGSKTFNSSHLESIATLTPRRGSINVCVAAPSSSRSSTTTVRRIAKAVAGKSARASAPALRPPVDTAGENFRPDWDRIAVSDVSTSGLVGLVHNLTIDGPPEFFANGILTHNCDELASWGLGTKDTQWPPAWDMLQFGLRLGDDPRNVVTTTPRPTKLIRYLLDDPQTVVTRGRTDENADNLAPAFLDQIVARYAGTRLGRQELDAEILDDVPGALWTYAMLEDRRPAPDLIRCVVGVDPSGSSDPENSEQGIVVAGKGIDGHGYVLADRSCRLSPDGWGRRAVQAYVDYQADAIVVERNFGGDMAESVISSAARVMGAMVKVIMVTASRGKAVRAQPVAALYEQKLMHHVEVFPELEESLTTWTPESGVSPDRLDALVWALTDVMLQPSTTFRPESGGSRPIVGQLEQLQRRVPFGQPAGSLRNPGRMRGY